ncbi:hypothetical protein HanRHA438_Chr04g0177961 [Helianthus annuus]|nr:hypothetical protein HanRHA438_Chr04g0177961 [Helianthus annuus]
MAMLTSLGCSTSVEGEGCMPNLAFCTQLPVYCPLLYDERPSRKGLLPKFEYCNIINKRRRYKKNQQFRVPYEKCIVYQVSN